ncbi:O-succinylhomoserine sulfhydrylase [Thiohalorhabdus methylotrophus]|uniref:O-succinylhomoserine sulfhydrylase n=1 Tax=Thiohalorhabdus methylotrophus TaxID=3242694 RepID=A0ABV4TUL3_9GAMM
MSEDPSFETRAIREGIHRTGEKEHSEALFPTSSFVFDTAEEAAARFAGESPGNIYSRFTNPTVRAFEERLASLEGGERGVAFASGMGAITATLLGLLNAGEHVVASNSLFGSTTGLLNNIFSRFGVATTFVDPADGQAWSDAATDATKLFFLETPSNPGMAVANIADLAERAHRAGAWLVVDNCFCTPALQRPLELGADLVVHSATKYLDGQGRCVGGAVVGPEALAGEKIFPILRSAGITMSPFNAWVFLKGLETLSLRMERHCDNAEEVAAYLAERLGAERVRYPGLSNHPGHALAKRQQSRFGGLLAFELPAGREDAFRFVNALKIPSITANLGDTKTTVTHPASTTHSRVSEAERQAGGVTEGLVRISVGLESAEDLKADLEQALVTAGLV